MSSLFNTRYVACRGLCWLLVILMFVSQSLPLMAQEEAEDDIESEEFQFQGQVETVVRGRAELPGDKALWADPANTPPDLTYMLPQACVVMALRPRQVLTAKALELFPIEVVQAASLQHTGLDPLTSELIIASVEPPMAGPPNYSVSATFTESVEGKLHPQLTAHTQPGELSGQAYLKSLQPFMPSIFAKDAKLLLAAPDMTLQKFVTGGATPDPGELLKKLAMSTSDDIYLAIDLQPLRPLINQLLMQQQNEIPPEMQFVYALPDLVRFVELRANLTGRGPSELVVEANNEFDATKILTILEQATQSWIDRALIAAAEFKQKDDPIEQAMGRYIERVIPQAKSEFMPKQDGAKLTLFRVDDSSNSAGLTSTATIGVLVALLLPAVQAAREAARRNQATNNMKQILLSFLNYHDSYGAFPAYANFDENGRPLLSWRVHILPYLEQKALYEQFHLDEPWDSSHNKKLISKIPQVYLDPSSPADPALGKSNYLGVLGKENLFDGSDKGVKLRQITDGTSNTVCVLQVNDQRSVIWTKPEDWELSEKNPLEGLAPNVHPGIFIAGFADGHVTSISQEIDLEVFKAMLTRNGGEIVNLR